MKKKTGGRISTKELNPSWYIAEQVVKRSGYSQKQLAEKMGVSVTSVHYMINHPPSIVHVQMLAEAIGCSFFDFFDFPAPSTESQQESQSHVFPCPHCGHLLQISSVSSND